jgi:hypothetical protein
VLRVVAGLIIAPKSRASSERPGDFPANPQILSEERRSTPAVREALPIGHKLRFRPIRAKVFRGREFRCVVCGAAEFLWRLGNIHFARRFVRIRNAASFFDRLKSFSAFELRYNGANSFPETPSAFARWHSECFTSCHQP